MNKYIRNFNLKSQRVASKSLFKYCNLEESEFEGKKVVWSLRNLEKQVLFFNRFLDFDDFNELKLGFKLKNGLDYYFDEAISGDVDSHLDDLSDVEVQDLKELFENVDNPDEIDTDTLITFLKTDLFKRVMNDNIEQSELLKSVPGLNHEIFISLIENMKNMYLTENRLENSNTKALDFQNWNQNKLDIEANKIDINQLKINALKVKMDEFKDIINNMYVCTCLSARYDNFNNWQVFSRGRNGFVIELDFSNQNLSFHNNFTFLKVKYSKLPVLLDLAKLNRIMKNPKDEKNIVDLLEYTSSIIKTKNYLLQGEQEVRIVAGNERLKGNEYTMEVSEFIRGVYIYRDNDSKYLDVLLDICKRNHIDIYWLKDSIDSYDLQMEKQTWSDIE